MKNFFVFIILLIVLIGIGGLFIKFVKEEDSQKMSAAAPVVVADNSYVYFWSSTCPHCANVQKFMDSWEKKGKIQIAKVEVNQSTQNSNLFVETAKECGLANDQIGVPLLVIPEGECIVGDNPIIEHFKSL